MAVLGWVIASLENPESTKRTEAGSGVEWWLLLSINEA
jgi:hypothetical protein